MGIIITGGGSRLEGIVQATEQALSSSARLGLPQDVTGPEEIITNQTYATAIGLLRADVMASPGWVPHKPSRGNSLWSRIKTWADDVF